jgi:hypothetical protein
MVDSKTLLNPVFNGIKQRMMVRRAVDNDMGRQGEKP